MFIDNQSLDTGDAAVVEAALETASRRVDSFCGRPFFAETDTRVFDGNGKDYMRIPDLLSATTVKLDEDGDRVFEVTLASATDYYLKRTKHRDEDATPYTCIELDTVSGQRSAFVNRKRLLQIVGSWGFTNETEAVASALAEDLDASETGVDVADGTLYSVGQTIKIDSEDMYISAIATNTLTVVRAMNGTTAAVHTNGTAITRYVYTPGVRTAALIIAARILKRRETGYANVSTNLLTGVSEAFRFYDPDVSGELADYVRGQGFV
jgi:hypothetical protein